MGQRSDEIIAEWADENRRTWVRRRDWRGTNRLAALCISLLLSGLVADLLSAPSMVATLCWVGAAASGAAILVRSYDRRYFITRRTDFQDRR